MVALAGASLTPMTGVTSVGTGATTPMTATALAREEVVAAAGLALGPDLALGPGHVDAAIVLAHAAVATAGAVADLHRIPGAEAGLAPLPALSPGLQ